MDRQNRYQNRSGGPYGKRAYRPVGDFPNTDTPPVTENGFPGNGGQPVSLAMAYVKNQPFVSLYSPAEALCHGTLFTELYMPYCAGGKRR